MMDDEIVFDGPWTSVLDSELKATNDALEAEQELSQRLADALAEVLVEDGWGVRQRAETALVAYRTARSEHG